MQDPERLRTLAAWYREFADKGVHPVIRVVRLRTAEDLEQEANRLELRSLALLKPQQSTGRAALAS